MAGCVHLCSASVVFTQPERHVVPTSDQSSVQAEFTFINKGETEVELLSATTTCGCATAVIVGLDGGKSRYAPGESGSIMLSLDLKNRKGRLSKTAIVRIRNGANGTEEMQTLRLTADVATAIDVSDSIVYWDIGEAPQAKFVTITIVQTDPVKLLSIDLVEGFTHEIVTVREGREYRVAITPVQTAKPASVGLAVRTDSRLERYRRIDLFTMVTQVQR